MPFLAPIFVGAAASGGAAATTGLIGAGGAVTAGGVAGAVGMGAGIAGGVMGAMNASAAAKSQSAMAKYNAEVKEQEAKTKREAGGIRANQIRERTRKMLSSQRASYAKAGVTTAGSPLTVMMETAEVGEMDALMTAYNAETGAGRSLSEATVQREIGKSAKRAGRMGVGSSLLGGATTAAGIYARKYGA